ncbi:hypothetical protein PMIN02_009589 [Paraphaeosphaeria minitans]
MRRQGTTRSLPRLGVGDPLLPQIRCQSSPNERHTQGTIRSFPRCQSSHNATRKARPTLAAHGEPSTPEPPPVSMSRYKSNFFFLSAFSDAIERTRSARFGS